MRLQRKERQQSSRSKIRKHTLKKIYWFCNFPCEIDNFKDYAKAADGLSGFVTLSAGNVNPRGVGGGGGVDADARAASFLLLPMKSPTQAFFRGAPWGLSSNPTYTGDVICGLSLLIDLG